MKSEPSSPSQSPCVYLTDTDVPLGIYVLELRADRLGLEFVILSFTCCQNVHSLTNGWGFK